MSLRQPYCPGYGGHWERVGGRDEEEKGKGNNEGKMKVTTWRTRWRGHKTITFK